ncbi:ATP-binding cassette domain-containing protein [Sandaracinobacter sp. RS1-74]|uniref:ABC transporter ATP-binding protein n=1 Tax=Sandaracinobacteroides sayramensis TaxID=2913411 RepID=UPI001EDB2CCC|nr:ATP-binding cassette domain-containing protein [Sandaracinobacteroides sayramensis]MCG2842057.1 ATP-binding cassette domain-containing protein [Sandaracinobacteroides sayramensis]
MLEAVSLTKDFGAHRALDTLDLRVDPGEIVCLLGANGAGKTTTINLFLGFLEPTSGEARVDGVDVRRDPVGSKRKLLYVPEQIALFGELSGCENLAYFVALSGLEDRSPAFLRRCLSQAGLPEQAMDRRASGYSKGMRQKVGLALAIAKEARALLLDEPTSGLDPQASAEFHDLIVRQRDSGAAVLMVTHDLFRAREVGTRIGLMRQGKLRRMLAAADITATELENLYLEEMGRVDG